MRTNGLSILFLKPSRQQKGSKLPPHAQLQLVPALLLASKTSLPQRRQIRIGAEEELPCHNASENKAQICNIASSIPILVVHKVSIE
jgi:hypothetical protein